MGKGRWSVRWFEAAVALGGLAAFAILVPLREVFVGAPGVMLVATLALFLTPGLMLARWFWRGYFSGVALAPVAFVASVGLFALAGVPLLILESTMGVYLWVCAAIVAASLLAAAVFAFLPKRPVEEQTGFALRDRGGVLWAPFLGLVGAMAYIARTTAPSSYGDIWIYLSWVRAYLGGNRLASVEPFFGSDVGLSRAKINGWLLEQAAAARVSGVDPIGLVFTYLNPALVVVAFLVFYALARVLFKSERVALFSGCLYALFFLVHLNQSRIEWGGEFIQRLPEDKLAAKFLFLPLALAFAYAFLEGGGKRYFWGFALLCATVMAVHPIGLAIIGISMAGFALLQLATEPRGRAAWARVLAMAGAGVAIIAVPAGLASLLADEPLSNALADSDINSGDPDVLRNMIFVSPGRYRIFEFTDGSYIMHPSLLLDPVIATAFLLGLPFLLWRLRWSLTARLLLGTMYITTVVVYAPPITTFLGDNVVLPGQIWRLAWPIQLASMLALGWVLWSATRYVSGWFEDSRAGRVIERALPIVLVIALTAAAVPLARPGLESIAEHRETSRTSGSYPADQIFPWLRDELGSPAVVLAPEVTSARIPAYSDEANVVSRRGGLVLAARSRLEERVPGQVDVPQGAYDVKDFFGKTSPERRLEILRRNRVDYVMVKKGSPLVGTLGRLPGFAPVGTPSDKYVLFAVDREKLPA